MGSGAKAALHFFQDLENREARMKGMTKHEGMTKSEAQSAREDTFIIRASSLIRHWSFIIRHFPCSSFCPG
jgi:hypothetical protein